MRRKLVHALFVVVAAAMITALAATPAYAGLDDEPLDGIHATTSSNPGAGPDHWWRLGWGRSLHPDFAFLPPDSMDWRKDGYIIGMLYSVDRIPAACTSDTVLATALINTSTPQAYYRANFGGTTDNQGPYGTNQDGTLDMLGIFANPPGGGWGPSDPNASYPVEGAWYMHYRYFTNTRYSKTVHTIRLGIDTTPPNPVTGLRLRTGLTGSDVTTWQPNTRAHITWDPGQYDALSGDGYYEVRIDDKAIIPEKNQSPEQGRVYSAPWLPTPSSITVEDMPPGKHKVSIVCVDRATNESTATSAFFYSDPDTPTVEITGPMNGLLKSSTYVSADAFDAAGDPRVTFSIDGVDVATIDAPPYRFKPDLTGLTPGAHVIVATATDHMSRPATATMTVSTTGVVVIPSDGFIPTDADSMNSTTAINSETNPDDSLGAASRLSWGNSVNPQISVDAPTPADGQGFMAGMVYRVDRTEGTALNPTTPDAYYASYNVNGTHLDRTIDLMGVFDYDAPTGGWPPSPLGGESTDYEGYWYFHFLPFTSRGYVPEQTRTYRFGIDVTDPRPVVGLTVTPGVNASPTTTWTSSSRAHLSWDALRYDDLSGIAYYKVLLDGDEIIPSDSQGTPIEVLGRTPSSVTIENMPAGKHKLTVIPVDRATNEGPGVSAYFYSDPDVPTIAFGSFGRTVSTRPTFSVETEDTAGIDRVVYRLDGTLIGTSDNDPYGLSPDLTSFSAGAHTLTATAFDRLGRSATATTTITIDKTPLSITSFSRTASIFYPIIREGYKDNSRVKFTLNKPATVTLYVRNSKGTTVRKISASFGSGANSILWNGKWSKDDKAHTGTYSYQLSGKDSVGFTDKTGKIYVKIRNYQLVKTSGNTIKVVPR